MRRRATKVAAARRRSPTAGDGPGGICPGTGSTCSGGDALKRPSPLQLVCWRGWGELATTYFRAVYNRTIMGEARFHFRVRDGTGWFPRSVVTRVGRTRCGVSAVALGAGRAGMRGEGVGGIGRVGGVDTTLCRGGTAGVLE